MADLHGYKLQRPKIFINLKIDYPYKPDIPIKMAQAPHEDLSSNLF